MNNKECLFFCLLQNWFDHSSPFCLSASGNFSAANSSKTQKAAVGFVYNLYIFVCSSWQSRLLKLRHTVNHEVDNNHSSCNLFEHHSKEKKKKKRKLNIIKRKNVLLSLISATHFNLVTFQLTIPIVKISNREECQVATRFLALSYLSSGTDTTLCCK
ncbi:hypothetical protein M9H77_18742 [Catharanthus roseus]|uniref:Uncharacterized protein n=1 Tax=Catharanthus roseus TaxID=4058 RepID=A0ACC0B8B9_CATRO|nr:hypothetical protein M9H77_18742 [Catharanthus roseus]